MLYLPTLNPPTIEELVSQINDAELVLALERELEAKNAEVQEWQKGTLVVGKAQAEAAEVQADLEEEADDGDDDAVADADVDDNPAA
mmetsp:Transcript_13420/g.32789  ORF Transcript_13420/g.32789 Transcript_13420/m.32789 type:complete len:87 (+) Transcript_13420:95-355(+)